MSMTATFASETETFLAFTTIDRYRESDGSGYTTLFPFDDVSLTSPTSLTPVLLTAAGWALLASLGLLAGLAHRPSLQDSSGPRFAPAARPTRTAAVTAAKPTGKPIAIETRTADNSVSPMPPLRSRTRPSRPPIKAKTTRAATSAKVRRLGRSAAPPI